MAGHTDFDWLQDNELLSVSGTGPELVMASGALLIRSTRVALATAAATAPAFSFIKLHLMLILAVATASIIGLMS